MVLNHFLKKELGLFIVSESMIGWIPNGSKWGRKGIESSDK
jgi:hypothetical protein